MNDNDIFNPAIAEFMFKRCNTSQEVHVFLYQQLSNLRKRYIEFTDAQIVKNNLYDNKVVGYDKVINELKNSVKAIDDTLLVLSTDFNNLSLDVSSTLNLYQTTINKLTENLVSLTVTVEKIGSELNELKQTLNTDLLEQILISYQQLFDKVENIVNTKVNVVKNELDNLALEMRTIEFALKNQIVSVQSAVNDRLDTQDLRITNFTTIVSNKIDNHEVDVAKALCLTKNYVADVERESEIRDDGLADRITFLTDHVSDEVAALYEHVNLEDKKLSDRIDKEEKERKDEDEILSKRICENVKHINELHASDKEQWKTINETLVAQNKLTETNIILQEKIETNRTNIHDNFVNNKNEHGAMNQMINDFGEKALITEQNVGLQYRLVLPFAEVVAPITYKFYDVLITMSRSTLTASDVKVVIPSRYYVIANLMGKVAENVPLSFSFAPIRTNVNDPSENIFRIYPRNDVSFRAIEFRIIYNPSLKTLIVTCTPDDGGTGIVVNDIPIPV